MRFIQEAEKAKDVEEDTVLLRSLMAENRTTDPVDATDHMARKVDRLPPIEPARTELGKRADHQHEKGSYVSAAVSVVLTALGSAPRWKIALAGVCLSGFILVGLLR